MAKSGFDFIPRTRPHQRCRDARIPQTELHGQRSHIYSAPTTPVDDGPSSRQVGVVRRAARGRGGGARSVADARAIGRANAAAIATIDILSRPGTYERMHGHGNAIRERIEAKAHELGHQLVTSGVGTAFSMHFDLEELPLRHADTLAANKEKFAAFRRNMLENNVLILPAGRWYISAVHTDKELERTLAAIDAGMAAI